MGRERRIAWSRRFAGLAGIVAVVAAIAVPVGAAPDEGSGPANLFGTVRDEGNRAAIQGVQVCLADGDGSGCQITDERGEYSFGNIPEGAYTLTTVPPVGTLYVPSAASVVTLGSGNQTQDIELLLGGALAITVFAPDGVTRAVGEPVSLCRTDAPGEPGSCPQPIPLPNTDANGQVTTTALLPGEYEVRAGAEHSPYGYPTAVTQVNVDPGVVNDVALRMIAGGSLDGFVRDRNGTAVAGATVSLNPASGAGSPTATSDPNGYYAFASLRPGSYTVTVTPPPSAPLAGAVADAIRIRSGETADADFVLAWADDVAPQVIGTPDTPPNQNGWYRAPVTITWDATDPAPASGVVLPLPPATTAAAEGIRTYESTVVSDNAGNRTTGRVTLRIDTVAPTVTCPSTTTEFRLGDPAAVVVATVTDVTSGPETATVSVPVDASVPGPGSASATGRDLAGNESTVSCGYTVGAPEGYSFRGFGWPVDNDRINVVKAGHQVPVSWRVVGADGSGVPGAATFGGITSATVACPAWPSDRVELTLPFSLAPRHVGGGVWLGTWRAPKALPGGCVQMTLTLGDGSTHSAVFRVVK